jgi:hypothetical protein
VIAVQSFIKEQLDAGRKLPFYEWSTAQEIDWHLFGGHLFDA